MCGVVSAFLPEVLSVAAGAHPDLLMEDPGEVQRIRVAYRMGDDLDSKLCALQKDTGMMYPPIQQVVLQGGVRRRLKDPMEIGAVDAQMVCDVLDRDGMAIVLFDIQQGFIYVTGPLTVGGLLGIGEQAGQMVEIFIQDAAHDQIPVFGKAVSLEHPLMTADQLRILPIMDHQVLRERGALQIPFDLDPLHPHPAIGPGIFCIGFVIDDLPGTDEKSISGF